MKRGPMSSIPFADPERWREWVEESAKWQGSRAQTNSQEQTGSGDGGPLAVTHLAWTDPETGERLMVELKGSEQFVQALERSGFEVLRSGESVPLSGGGSGTEEWSSAGAVGDRARTGPIPTLRVYQLPEGAVEGEAPRN